MESEWRRDWVLVYKNSQKNKDESHIPPEISTTWCRKLISELPQVNMKSKKYHQKDMVGWILDMY